ncbi:MAG TPA: hypothetical protein VGK82_18870 [Pyrinomonadaceae bacterium]
MPKDNENIRLFGLGPLASPAEPQGFAPEQMIRCEECLRANPPTRINCMYCSVPLPVTESSAHLRTPVLRRPEKHELGYNTIVLPSSEVVGREAIENAASLLRLKPEELERILAEGVALPVARTASREEAELIADRLQTSGFRVVTLRDEDAVVRVRSLSFHDSTLVMNPAQITNEVDVAWSNVVLLVSGRIVEKRVEVKEIKSRGAENEILDTSELFSDEAVIDLYVSGHSETWRISANGFDFSCLGAEKTLLATENIATLQRALNANATNARLDDSYNRVRPLLDLAWGPEQETKSSGWRRERPGKLSLGMTTIHNNESQFTRYSRLLFHLATHSLD